MPNKKRRNNKAVFRKFAAAAATTTLLVSPLAPAANAIADSINENMEQATEQVVEKPTSGEGAQGDSASEAGPSQEEGTQGTEIKEKTEESALVTESRNFEEPMSSNSFVPAIKENTTSEYENSGEETGRTEFTGTLTGRFGSFTVTGNVRANLEGGVHGTTELEGKGAWNGWSWTLNDESLGNSNVNQINAALSSLDAGTATLVGVQGDFTVTFNVVVEKAEATLQQTGTIESREYDGTATATMASEPVFGDELNTEGVFEGLIFSNGGNAGNSIAVGREDGQSMVDLLEQKNPNFSFTMSDNELFEDATINPRIINVEDLGSFEVKDKGTMTKVFDGTDNVTNEAFASLTNPTIAFEVAVGEDETREFETSINLKEAVGQENIKFGSANVGTHNAVVDFSAIEGEDVIAAVETALGTNFKMTEDTMASNEWQGFINTNSNNFIEGEITPLELTANDLDFDAIGDQLTKEYDGTDTFDKESITVPLKSAEGIEAFTTNGVQGITFTWDAVRFASANIGASLIFDGFGYDSQAFGNAIVAASNGGDIEPNIKIDLEGIEETLSELSGITQLELNDRLLLGEASTPGQVSRVYDGTTDIDETNITDSPIVQFTFGNITLDLVMDIPAEYLSFADKNAGDNVPVTIDFDALVDEKGLDGILDLIAQNNPNITFADDFSAENIDTDELAAMIQYEGTINRVQLGVTQAEVTKTFDGTTDLTADHILGEPKLTGFVSGEGATFGGDMSDLSFAQPNAGSAKVVGDDWTVTADEGTNLANYILPGELPESIIPVTFTAPSFTQSFFTPFEDALNGEEESVTIAVDELFDGFIESAQGANLVLDGTVTQTAISLSAEIDHSEGHMYTDENGHAHTYILTNAPAVGGVIDPATIVATNSTGEFTGLSAGTTYYAYAVSAHGVNPLTRGGIMPLADGSSNFHQGEIATLGTTGEISTLPADPAPAPEDDDTNDSGDDDGTITTGADDDDDTITTGAYNVGGPSASGNLPDTGDANGQFAALGAGILGLSALAAWLKRSRKSRKANK